MALRTNSVDTGAACLMGVHCEMPRGLNARNKESSNKRSKFPTKQQGGASAASESGCFNQADLKKIKEVLFFVHLKLGTP